MDVYFESAMCKLFNVFPTQCTFFICLGSWVSVGSESLLTAYDGSCSIMKPLRGREVVLFPDLGAEDKLDDEDVDAPQSMDLTARSVR